MKSDPHDGSTVAIVTNLVRGELRYPSLAFVSILMTMENAANFTQELFAVTKPLGIFVVELAPVAVQNPLFFL